MFKNLSFFSLTTFICYLCITTPTLGTQLELLTFGDSITAGLRRSSSGVISCPEGVAFAPALFSDFDGLVCNGEGAEGVGGYQPTLKSSLEDLGYTPLVYNYGFSGLLTSEMVGLTSPFLAAEPNSDYVLVMGGANDAFRDVSTSTVNFNIQSMIRTICRRDMIPVITTVTRRQSSSTINNTVISYNNAINQIGNPSDCSGRNIQLITADQYNATIDASNYSDGLHLTGIGNLNMANEWFRALGLPSLLNNSSFLPSIYLLLND